MPPVETRLDGVDDRPGRRAGAKLDRREWRSSHPSGRCVGHPERDRVDVQQVERTVQLDPVTRGEAAAVRTAAGGVIGRHDVRAGLVDRVLHLLLLLPDLVLRLSRQSRHATRSTEVLVHDADHTEHVAAVRDVVRVRRQDAGAAGARRLGVAVRVVAEHERGRDAAAVDRTILGVGHRDRVGDVVAEGERSAVDRHVDGHRRSGVADRDRRVRTAALAARVGDRQPRRVLAA